MLIPSIDLMGGSTVQLRGGSEKVLDAGDPLPLLERFARVGEVAVIDLDAALGTGSNQALIEELVRQGPCRIGGGIRSVEAAIRWLDRGARKVILGTAATPAILEQLPADRVIAALDAVNGEVVVEGWRTSSGRTVVERMRELDGLVGGFLVTFVEREGRMEGIDLGQVEALVRAAGSARLTIAGGVTTPEELAALDRLGVEAQVGMALYTGRLGLGQAVAAPLRSDRADGLWPTVVVDEGGRALGLAYSSLESLEASLESGSGVYCSRRRGLWRKGEQSGATQELLRVDLDCDRDTLRFQVRQRGPGFCHQGTPTCWEGLRGGDGLEGLLRTLEQRRRQAPAGSYTARLLEDPRLLRAKLIEEAGELAEAGSESEVIHEAADLLYFTAAALARAGVSLAQVEAELGRRRLSVSRRGGEAKERGR